MPIRIRLAVGALIALAACSSPLPPPPNGTIREIILAELARHPAMGPADMYKLLHTATMGSEHAMTDTAGIKAWMTEELATMGEGPAEQLVDTIAPNGAVVRVNLRPWVAAGRSTDSLVNAFIKTAAVFPADTAYLSRYMATAESLAVEGKTPFSLAEWRELIQAEQARGFPALHHSEQYVAAYHPAYRVIAGPLVP